MTPPTTSSKTKAVVLMFGWFGSEMKHVRKYADLYIHRKCAVVYGIAPSLSVMIGHKPSFRKLAIESVGEVCKLVRQVEGEKRVHTIQQEKGRSLEKSEEKALPIVVHSFSNGGAFVTTVLTSMMKELKEQTEEKESQDKIDLRLFSDRIKSNGFEVFDSAPAYLYPEKFHLVIETAIQNVPAQVIFKGFSVIGKVLTQLSDFLRKKEPFPIQFWNEVIEGDMCKRQAFLYSTKDTLTDFSKIEELIQIRKSRGFEVIALNFKDSDHVQHWRKYPKEYENVLEEVLSMVLIKSMSTKKRASCK